jgi:hypothetical protein
MITRPRLRAPKISALRLAPRAAVSVMDYSIHHRAGQRTIADSFR